MLPDGSEQARRDVGADQSVVGDRDFMGVSSEIVDRLLWPAEGSFTVDNRSC